MRAPEYWPNARCQTFRQGAKRKARHCVTHFRIPVSLGSTIIHPADWERVLVGKAYRSEDSTRMVSTTRNQRLCHHPVPLKVFHAQPPLSNSTSQVDMPHQSESKTLNQRGRRYRLISPRPPKSANSPGLAVALTPTGRCPVSSVRATFCTPRESTSN